MTAHLIEELGSSIFATSLHLWRIGNLGLQSDWMRFIRFRVETFLAGEGLDSFFINLLSSRLDCLLYRHLNLIALLNVSLRVN